MLRIATSVEPDPGSSPVPVRLPWLPSGLASPTVTISGPSRATWRAEIYDDDLTVIVGATAEAPAGGETFTLAGRPARHPVRRDSAGRRLSYLVVGLGHGRWMTLVGSGTVSFDDLTKIAYSARPAPAGLDWLG
jgi:hypothetical protein